MSPVNRHAARLALLCAMLLAVSVAAPAPVSGLEVAAAGPTVDAPRARFVAPSKVTAAGAVPLLVSWPNGTPAGSPIYRYQLQLSLDDSPWSPVTLSSRLARSVRIKVRPWQSIALRLRAVDSAGTAGEWAVAEPLWLAVAQEDDEAIAFSSGWQMAADSKAFGGGRATTGAPEQSATFAFVGREVAWVAQRGPTRGVADVYVDGLWAATIDLRKKRNAPRRIVFRASWADVGGHTVEIRTQGTAGRPTVDVDAFVVLADPTSETLVGAGDIASCAQEIDQATADLVETVEGIVFTAGDNVYPDGSANYFADCYEPTWGAFKARTRPAPGNHDYYNNPGAGGYFDYFGANAGPHGRGWYSYEAGTWRIYSLTSECRASSACGLAQREWLRADLAAEPHRCVAAYWHRPRWSTGPHGDSPRVAALIELLHDAGAEMVIAAHDHSYQRFAPAAPDSSADPAHGVRQFIVGTGGAALYAFRSEHPLLEVRDNTSHGVLRLDLAPGSYAWEFMAANGSFTDSGAASCH